MEKLAKLGSNEFIDKIGEKKKEREEKVVKF